MRELRFAIKNTVPIFFTYLFIGIAYGVLMSGAGYSAALTAASSLFIYAGSLQLTMVPLMKAGASLPSLAVLAFFINARHLFYGIGFIERFRTMGWRRPYMIFALTDETYSVLCNLRAEEGPDGQRAMFLIALLDHLYWVLGSTAGALAGTFLPFDTRGIEFSATAFFLVVAVNQWRESRTRLPFLLAAACALVFLLLLGKESFLIPTLTACTLGLALLRGPVEKRLERRERPDA